jgi:hypothetical protein
MQKEHQEDPQRWWNKLQTMGKDDYEKLPDKVRAKYYSMANKMINFEKQLQFEYKMDDPRF